MVRSVAAVPFALGLTLFLFAVVLLLNLLGPVAVPISGEQFDRLREADLVESLIINPYGAEWQLKQMVRVQGREGDQRTQRVALMEDVEDGHVAAWRASGGRVRQEEGSSQWLGVLFVIMLLGVGGWYLWSQIQLDLKGPGSPRRRLQALEEDRKAGRISEEEFRRRAEQVWPEL
ncbi:MAG: hypothetical protein QGH25_20755 [Candidatus Latescibacteria bacterium]|nr:hypothetical protein [Candidatus Latescibacterota bacterium]